MWLKSCFQSCYNQASLVKPSIRISLAQIHLLPTTGSLKWSCAVTGAWMPSQQNKPPLHWEITLYPIQLVGVCANPSTASLPRAGEFHPTTQLSDLPPPDLSRVRWYLTRQRSVQPGGGRKLVCMLALGSRCVQIQGPCRQTGRQ